MHIQHISYKNTSLYLEDTGRKEQKSLYKKLLPLLKRSIAVANRFAGKWISGQQLSELTLTLCGEKKIRSLNREFRKKDKVTDVLSFPVHDFVQAKDGIKDSFMVDLGNIYICKERALDQSKLYEISWEDEIVHLFVHGFLHLCGYDHELSDKDALVMEKLEQKLVGEIYNGTSQKNKTR